MIALKQRLNTIESTMSEMCNMLRLLCQQDLSLSTTNIREEMLLLASEDERSTAEEGRTDTEDEMDSVRRHRNMSSKSSNLVCIDEETNT